ncbi:relA-associated inhibitor isoform X1 [Paroedura picta]|uniref:relA-associated inhibitor isoform X1 n=1 Tax=Paroedura picta TaxID=143630 RepID=UPI0040570339
MAREEVGDARAILELNFQSLASKHMDLKQVELDTAAAKVDELSKQLESLWTGSAVQSSLPQKMERPSSSSWPSQDGPVRTVPITISPSWKNSSLDSAESYSSPYSFGENSPSFSPVTPSYGSSPNQLFPAKSTLGRPTSPRPSIFLQPELDRATSPRPKVLPVPYESMPGSVGRPSSPRFHWSGGPLERQYDYKAFPGPAGRAGSPRLPTEGSGPPMFFPERAPSPRPPLPPPYENHSMYPSMPNTFPPFRTQDDLVLRRRAQKGWNESDLDVAYEKKPSHPVSYERADLHGGFRQSAPGLPLTPWRESSLDGGAAGQGKEEHYGMHSATLPRNYKVSPLASERRSEGSFRRSLPANQTGTLPRNWQYAQQPVSRIPMPPPSPQGSRPKRHKPLPLSMIFRLQNAFWEYGASGTKLPFPQGLPGSPLFRSPQKQMPPQPLNPAQPHGRMAPPGSEGGIRALPLEVPAEPARLVPTPLLAGEMEPELESLLPGSEPPEVGEVTRPLSPTRLQPVLPPEAQKVPEFEEVARVLAEMPRPLKRRGSMEQCPSLALPPTHKKQYQQIISRLFHHHGRKEEAGLVGEAAPPMDLVPISEASEQKAAVPPPQSPAIATPVLSAPDMAESPSTASPGHSPEKRSALRKISSPQKRPKQRARLNPLVLLLDAALTGELDVVKEAVAELNDPSQPNDEGITALHNAICGANYNIVDFLINIGANVNSPDSHGWTPLHCAASCNDTAICIALVKHGAAIFATTCSDGSMAIEKCDPYREGYSECFSYLAAACKTYNKNKAKL